MLAATECLGAGCATQAEVNQALDLAQVQAFSYQRGFDMNKYSETPVRYFARRELNTRFKKGSTIEAKSTVTVNEIELNDNILRVSTEGKRFGSFLTLNQMTQSELVMQKVRGDKGIEKAYL